MLFSGFYKHGHKICLYVHNAALIHTIKRLAVSVRINAVLFPSYRTKAFLYAHFIRSLYGHYTHNMKIALVIVIFLPYRLCAIARYKVAGRLAMAFFAWSLISRSVICISNSICLIFRGTML